MVEDKVEKTEQASPHPLVESELTQCGQRTIMESSMMNMSLETNVNQSNDLQGYKGSPEAVTQKEVVETKEKKKGKKKTHQLDPAFTPIARKTRSHDGKENIDYLEVDDKETNTKKPEEVMESIMAHAMTLKDYKEKDKEEDTDLESRKLEPERKEDNMSDSDESSEDELVSDSDKENDKKA